MVNVAASDGYRRKMVQFYGYAGNLLKVNLSQPRFDVMAEEDLNQVAAQIRPLFVDSQGK